MNAFTIKIPISSKDISAVQQEALRAIVMGVKPEMVGMDLIYPFDYHQVDQVTTGQLATLKTLEASGVTCEGKVGQRFVELTKAAYTATAPTSLEMTKPGEDEKADPVAMSVAEALPFASEAVDGKTVLVQLAPVAFGSTCGDGLSWEEYQKFLAAYPGKVLMKSEAETLRTAKYIVAMEAEVLPVGEVELPVKG